MMRKIKDFILMLDKKYFNEIIVNCYARWLGRNKLDYFKKKKTVVLNEPVSDLIVMQVNQDNGLSNYCFYDVAVRYLFIQQYYKQNEVGYDLYRKMHTLRGNYGQVNNSEKEYEKQRKKGRLAVHGQAREEHSIEQFESLVSSYEKYGYNNSLIMADKNLLNINGSHRVALAAYRKQKYILVEIHNKAFHRAYDINWFWANGFTYNEIDLIKSTMNSIYADAKKQIGNYYCILFPPAEEYFDQITKDINAIDASNITVEETCDYIWEVPDFVGFLKCIYSFDSINSINLERKIMYILRASEIKNNKVHFRILSLNIVNPMYRLKNDNGMPEAMATVKLKDVIRQRYKVKDKKFTTHFEGDYAHDVIIHSSDNYISNNAFRAILGIDKDISEFIEVFKEYKHCFTTKNNEKISEKFPHNFYYGEDIDVLVKRNDLEEITDKIFSLCCSRYAISSPITVKRESSSHGIRVRILYESCTITMFDLMASVNGFNQSYLESMLDNSNTGELNYLGITDEIAYRLCKYIDNNTKKYHLKFVKDNIDNGILEIDKITACLDSNYKHKANKIIADLRRQ